ncbi:hypothetical protein HBA55_08015 [Pseudomaricurvus alkylphenolicus]|jgi:cytochrome oxidase Cu insertion factor (SCO1/SenC/PrrC family)|uniref:SCO family protein n=1 Tax=Pseudomaricurvus alkylphenolicus TaxID=1306991 RepID=UPI00141DFE1A|nr:hypothetical protein [Pseudomaricurvus alkylphenolicus]NIB39527.1 hypothetical protein [Pseudomaricurvus alkylphenolicus]
MAAEMSAHPNTSETAKPWVSWLLFGIIGAPMALAYFIYATGWGIPTGTVNRGDLLLPATSITALNINDSQGSSLNLWEGKKRWRMLIVGDNYCADQCRDMLYLTRQVHIRLGEKARRVERVFLNVDGNYSQELLQTLQRDHPKLVAATTSLGEWQDTLASTNGAEHQADGARVYLVDQEGFAMMSFDDGHEGADLLEDIKRLLKYSYED